MLNGAEQSAGLQTQRIGASTKVDLKQELSMTIEKAINQVVGVEQTNLTFNEFSVKVAFTIERTNSGTAEYELSPITPSASRKVKKKAVHTVEIVFNKPA